MSEWDEYDEYLAEAFNDPEFRRAWHRQTWIDMRWYRRLLDRWAPSLMDRFGPER